jgi:hypothetical protein
LKVRLGLIAGLCEKYEEFNKLIEYRASDIFMMIPMIMIIKSCEGDDKGICEIFLPDLKNTETKLGKIFLEITRVLFETNQILSLQDDTDSKARPNSLNRSLKNALKHARVSPDKKMEPRSMAAIQSLGESSEPSKYKTILSNKSEYKTNVNPLRKAKEKPVNNRLNYSFYNLMEKLILNIDLNEKERESYELLKDSINGAILKVKNLSIELERYDPVEWNTFLDVALES